MADSKQSVTPAADPLGSSSEVVWVSPAPVALSIAAVAAALYAFSDLIDDQPEPGYSAVREELRFLVAQRGTMVIERVADLLALHGAGPLPTQLAAAHVSMDGRPLAARLTWCQQQAALLLDQDQAWP